MHRTMVTRHAERDEVKPLARGVFMTVCPKVKRQVLSTRTSHCYGHIPRTVKLVAPFYDWNLSAPFLNYHFELDCRACV